MTNEQAKAYAKLALKAIFEYHGWQRLSRAELTQALENNMEIYMDTYTEEEAVRKAEKL